MNKMTSPVRQRLVARDLAALECLTPNCAVSLEMLTRFVYGK